MTISAAHHALRFGVRFNPTPEEAISVYLRRWALGEPLPDTADIIHEAEVYKFEPKDLAAAFPPLPRTENRFFFTTCKRRKAGRGRYTMSRTAGAGSWVSSVKKMVKNSAGETIGYSESLRYTYKDDKSRASSDCWLMEEYHLADGSAAVVGSADQERLFCRVYRKAGSVTLQQPAAGDHRRLDLGMQEPAGSTMAAAARRQEPAVPVLPVIKKRPRQPCVTAPPPQATDRPAPRAVEPPPTKRMRVAAALPSLEVPPRPQLPRRNMVGYNTPKGPSWYHAPVEPPQAPTAKRKSSRSPFADPSPPPAAEATADAIDADEFASLLAAELEMALVDEDHSIVQQEAGNEEDDDGLASWLEGKLEEEHTKIQDEEEEEGQHQHARLLEGLVVDERGDDDVAKDLFDGLKDIDDPIIDGEGEDWASKPLSDYNDILLY